jgi:hypothetical protein
MMRKARRVVNLVCAAALLVSAPAMASSIVLPTDLGPETFDTNNFATSLAASSCSGTCLAFGTGVPGGLIFGPLSTATIEPWLVGADLSNGVGLGAGPAGAAMPDYVIPAFGLLASISNGPGADFVIWEAGAPAESVYVSVSLGGGAFSAPILYPTGVAIPADSSSGYVTNSVHINLDDFGIASLGLIDQVRIQGLFTGIGGSGPDILAAAALNAGPPTIPEPTTLALLGLGLTFVASRKRRR